MILTYKIKFEEGKSKNIIFEYGKGIQELTENILNCIKGVFPPVIRPQLDLELLEIDNFEFSYQLDVFLDEVLDSRSKFAWEDFFSRSLSICLETVRGQKGTPPGPEIVDEIISLASKLDVELNDEWDAAKLLSLGTQAYSFLQKYKNKCWFIPTYPHSDGGQQEISGLGGGRPQVFNPDPPQFTIKAPLSHVPNDGISGWKIKIEKKSWELKFVNSEAYAELDQKIRSVFYRQIVFLELKVEAHDSTNALKVLELVGFECHDKEEQKPLL